MFILTGIGQIIVFLLVWRLFLWGGAIAKRQLAERMTTDLIINLLLSIVLIILLRAVHEIWWMSAYVGAFVGLFAVQVTTSSRPK